MRMERLICKSTDWIYYILGYIMCRKITCLEVLITSTSLMLLLHTIYMSMLLVMPIYLYLEFGYIAVTMSFVICLTFKLGTIKHIFTTDLYL
jgi:hypothetical protein